MLQAWAVWALVLLGGVYLVTQSLVGMPVRMLLRKRSVWLAALLYCPTCTAFWLGVALDGLGLTPHGLDVPWSLPLGGFMAMGFVWGSQRLLVLSDAWTAESTE